MKESYIIQIHNTNGLIQASCLAEAKYKARRMNGRVVGQFSTEDYILLNTINNNLK